MHETLPNGDEEEIILAESSAERDLGVLVDDKLSFKQHIAQVVAKANRVVGVIRRSYEFLDEVTFVLLFKSLVRPILEYSNVAWQPHLKYLKADLESVQRRATRLLPGMDQLSYEERLRKLKLPSLEFRRRRGDMIEAFKYLNKIYDTEKPELKLSSNTHTRTNKLKLDKPIKEKLLRSGFFTRRIIDDWNKLPASVVGSPSVNIFKNRLDNVWKNDPTKFAPTCLV